MKEEKNNTESLKDIAPILSNIEKKNAFKAPENYFESLLHMNIDKDLNKNILKSFFDKLSYRFFVPLATIFLLIMCVFYLYKNTSLNPLTDEQLSEFLMEDDFLIDDDYLVYEAYSEMVTQEQDWSMEEDETELYIDYLLEANIDLDAIAEEL